MTDLSAEFKALASYRPTHKVRFVTAASLFDGHDAAINIMRRILQGMGCEVIHLGHNRSVEEVVTAALQEDVQGIAISSYQGGHVEYFKYMVDLLRERGGEHIQVFGGGGGVIVPPEIRELQAYGVSRIYSPEDGQRMGLAGNDRRDDDALRHRTSGTAPAIAALQVTAERLARRWRRLITALETASRCRAARDARRHATRRPCRHHRHRRRRQVSLPTRFRAASTRRPPRIAVISIDPPAQERRRPARRPHPHERDRALAQGPRVFAHSATRRLGSEIQQALPDVMPPARPPASISSSSRPAASARATRRSCRWSTCRCT
jgi:methylmalonyl-CoA mutase